MRLDEVMAADVAGAAAVQVTALAYDSRRVCPGTLFFCVPGFTRDGHDHAPEAVSRGACALVVERPLDLGVPEVRVDSVRAAMGPAAARFFADPTRRLAVVGVTGTNGKTTTAFILRGLLQAVGRPTALLGTVKSVIAGREQPTQRTTPEAIDLQGDFVAMLDAGDRGCVMEVSSHALALGRTRGIHFAVAVFTNLTQDHLDFHPTMEDYYQAKRRLFAPEPSPGPRAAVINVDDPYGRRLAAEIPAALTFALERDAHFCARELSMGLDGARFTLDSPSGALDVSLPLPGRFNVANALAALAAAHALGVHLDEAIEALAQGVSVPGRFEPVDEGQDFAVLVDYAHTPDGLENVLRAARDLARGQVLCVFGAGGDRDRAKRPLMGEIAARLADIVVVTSDNPRSEDPESIIGEIMAGVHGAEDGKAPVIAVPDRRQAVSRAVAQAHSGDVLVIAGKGHEQGQELAGGRRVPFDDVMVARAALRARRALVGRGGPP